MEKKFWSLSCFQSLVHRRLFLSLHGGLVSQSSKLLSNRIRAPLTRTQAVDPVFPSFSTHKAFVFIIRIFESPQILPGSAYPWRFILAYVFIVMPPIAIVTIGDLFFLIGPMIQDMNFYGNVFGILAHDLQPLRDRLDMKVNRYLNDKSLGLDFSPDWDDVRISLTDFQRVCKEFDPFIRACGIYFFLITFGTAPIAIISLTFTLTEKLMILRILFAMIFFMAAALIWAFAIRAAIIRKRVCIDRKSVV